MLFSPNIRQIQFKSQQHLFNGNTRRIFHTFDIVVCAINVNFLLIRINQPAESRAVFDIFAHFRLQFSQDVGFRPEFDDEIRHDAGKTVFALFLRKRLIFFLRNPKSVGRAFRAIWQSKHTVGFKSDSGFVLFRSNSELNIYISIFAVGF